MKEKLLKLLEFDSNTARTEYRYMELINGNVLFTIENTRKYAIVEEEFTPEEFETVMKLFGLTDDGSLGFIGEANETVFSQEELKVLGSFTVLQLAQDLETGLLHAGNLAEDTPVAKYLRERFIPQR